MTAPRIAVPTIAACGPQAPIASAALPILQPRMAAGLALALLVSWQLVAAFVVEVEYYDGFDTIANARFFLGDTDVYIINRSPMFALLLVPAQWLRARLDLHPLDVTFDHLTFGALHVA